MKDIIVDFFLAKMNFRQNLLKCFGYNFEPKVHNPSTIHIKIAIRPHVAKSICHRFHWCSFIWMTLPSDRNDQFIRSAAICPIRESINSIAFHVQCFNKRCRCSITKKR